MLRRLPATLLLKCGVQQIMWDFSGTGSGAHPRVCARRPLCKACMNSAVLAPTSREELE